MSVENLPEEILFQIFTYLSLKDLHWGVRQTCKSWYELTHVLPLWKKIDLDENQLSTKLGNESFLKLLESVAKQVEELKFGKLKFLSDKSLLHEGIFCPNLKGLNFTETDISTETVCGLLQKYPQTSKVFIKNCESVVLVKVLDEISKLADLRKLTLGHPLKTYSSDEWNSKLCKVFESSPNLEEVGFVSRNITNETIEVLLRHCPKLKTLSLTHCSAVSDEAFDHSVACVQMEDLKFTSAGISDKGLQKLSQKLPNLKSVTVKRCVNITDIGFGHLASNCKKLEKLIINDIQLDDGNITNVGIQLLAVGCKNLRVLQANYCPGVSNEGVIALAEHCSHLAEIGVAGCMSLNDDAILALAKNCQKLQNVNLTACVQVGAKSINSLVVNCPKLQVLKLENCHSIAKLNFDEFFIMETPFTEFDKKRNGDKISLSSQEGYKKILERAEEDLKESTPTDIDSGNGENCMKAERKIINDPKLTLKSTKDTYFVNDHKISSGNEQILEVTKEILDRRPSSSLSSSDNDLTSCSEQKYGSNFSVTSDLENPERFGDEKSDEESTEVKTSGRLVTADQMYGEFFNIPVHSHLQVLHIGFCSKISNDSIRQIAMHCPDLRDFSICACYQVTDSAVEFLVEKCKFLQILDISGGSPLESTKLTNRSLLALAKYGSNIKELVILRNNLITPDGIKEVLVNCTHLKSIWFLTGESTPVSLQAVLSIISSLTNRVAKLRTYKVPVWSDFGGRRSRVKVELFDTAFMH